MPHPNRARLTRAAARSGYPVAKLGALPAADRQAVLDALNNGRAALITTAGGAQFVMPLPAPEAE